MEHEAESNQREMIATDHKESIDFEESKAAEQYAKEQDTTHFNLVMEGGD